MLNIFYQNKSLVDTLIINVSNLKADKVNTNNGVTIGYKDGNVVFCNIINASKILPNLVPGLIFPEPKLMEEIKKLTDIDFLKFFDNGFKIAEIIKCEDIQGTHLHKTEVNVGDKILHIVCGAPNARTGLKTVCATNGTMLPDGKQIIAGQLLGNKSEGMLCSFRELGLPQNTERGIIELTDDYKIGDYFNRAYSNIR